MGRVLCVESLKRWCGGDRSTRREGVALGTAVAGTLVAAGEATAGDGENGTVQGAIASGRRAAQALLVG